MTAALCAAMAFVLFDRLRREGVLKASLIPCASVDMRQFTPELQGAFGCYAFGGKWPCPLLMDESSTFWDVAAQASRGLKAHATAERAFDSRRFHDYAHALRDWRSPRHNIRSPNGYWDALEEDWQGRDSSFNVSNLGTVLSSGTLQFRISETYAAVSQVFPGSYMSLSAASVGNRLCLSLAAVDPIVSKPSLASFTQSLVHILMQHVCTAEKTADG